MNIVRDVYIADLLNFILNIIIIILLARMIKE